MLTTIEDREVTAHDARVSSSRNVARDALLRRLDSPLICVGIAALLYGIFLFGRLARTHWDATRFIVIGEKLSYESERLPNTYVWRGGVGYDGEFYYRFALDPITKSRAGFGVVVDTPAYRHQRILYPVLSHVVALGDPKRVPVAMILVNYVALCAIAGLAATYANQLRKHALWGLTVAFYPGFLLSLSRDLTEILQACFLILTLLLLRQRRYPLATLSIILAILTRETALTAVVAAASTWLLVLAKRTRGAEIVPWYFVTVPVAIVIAWQVVLYKIWNQIGFVQNSGAFSFPFVSFLKFFVGVSPFRDGYQPIWFWECCFLICFFVIVFSTLRRSQATVFEMALFFICFLQASFLSSIFWTEDWGFMRGMTEVFITGSIVMLSGVLANNVRIFYATILGVMWFLLSCDLIGSLR